MIFYETDLKGMRVATFAKTNSKKVFSLVRRGKMHNKRKYVLIWISLVISLMTSINSAGADESCKPLGVAVAVTSSCALSIPNSVSEHSVEAVKGLFETSGLIHDCGKRAVYKVDVQKNTAKNGVIQLVVNFGMIE